MWPVPSRYGISTPFGRRGSYWGCLRDSSGRGIHTGVDFAAPKGTPIYAPISGQIRYRNYGKAFGPYQFAISPDANQPFGQGEVFFAHCTYRLKDGTRVKAGQKISEVGALGNVTGPHLHMEFMPASKNRWSCGLHADPGPVLAWGITKPPTAEKWLFPNGHKVYQKYLKYEGHLQNPDKISDSIKGLQEMLRRHGYPELPTTGRYLGMTDDAVRNDQAKHLPPADPDNKSFVGPKQFDHLKKATACPYVWVADDSKPPPTEPEKPPVEHPRPKTPSVMIPGAEWDPIPKKDGSWFTGLRPFKTGGGAKIVLHTTETEEKPNWEVQQSGIPHATVDLRTRDIWQHLPLGIAAYTLVGGDGPSPNSDGGVAIQLEIIGHAAESPTWDDDEYEFLKVILVFLSKELDVAYTFPYPFTGNDGYGDQGAVRLTWDEYRSAEGVLGHSHAPYNKHWDPGDLDLKRLTNEGPSLPDPDPEPETPEIDPDEYVTKDEFTQLRVEFDAWRRDVGKAFSGDDD